MSADQEVRRWGGSRPKWYLTNRSAGARTVTKQVYPNSKPGRPDQPTGGGGVILAVRFRRTCIYEPPEPANHSGFARAVTPYLHATFIRRGKSSYVVVQHGRV